MKLNLIKRRHFLAGLGTIATWPFYSRGGIKFSQANDLQKAFAEVRVNLLQMINEEREVAKLSPLETDELATTVATAHAEDMSAGEFASHWGRDGLKPYQRYSFAGGFHATQENVSAADNTWSMKTKDLKQDTSYLHIRLYQETPPNDGHRRTILAPQHTHVGFGLSVEKLRLRMVELFVSKYVELKPGRQSGRPGSEISISGKLLKSSYSLNSIEVCYEPLPKPPELSWLRQPRPYSLPDESRILKPILPAPYLYADQQPGVIQVEPSGQFHTTVRLFKNSPGIYTVVCWVKRNRNEKAFPATEYCIRAE